MHNTRLHICACILTQSALILSLSDYLIYTCTHWLTHSHLRALSETDRQTYEWTDRDRQRQPLSYPWALEHRWQFLDACIGLHRSWPSASSGRTADLRSSVRWPPDVSFHWLQFHRGHCTHSTHSSHPTEHNPPLQVTRMHQQFTFYKIAIRQEWN